MTAAEREVVEEMGYRKGDAVGNIILLAEGLNANSAYFDTSNITDTGRPAGVAIFAMPISHTFLEKVTHNDEEVYVFPKHVRDATEGESSEKIYGSMFVPIKAAVQSRDMFTSAAAGQLLARILHY